MHKQCWYRLKMDVSNALRPDWKLTVPPEGWGVWQPKSKEIFTDEWLEYTKSIGLPIFSALVFYRGPYGSSRDAHVDTHQRGLKTVNFAINWVVGGVGSKMHWYDTPTKKGVLNSIDPRAPYVSHPFSELTEIANCHIGSEVTLVRTSYPHSISMGKDPRWCFSARTNIDEDMPWDDVVSLMRSRNLLVEK